MGWVSVMTLLVQMPCFYSLVLQRDGVEGVALREAPGRLQTVWCSRDSLLQGSPIRWDVSPHTRMAKAAAGRLAHAIDVGIAAGAIDLSAIGPEGRVTRWDWVCAHGTKWAAADGW